MKNLFLFLLSGISPVGAQETIQDSQHPIWFACSLPKGDYFARQLHARQVAYSQYYGSGHMFVIFFCFFLFWFGGWFGLEASRIEPRTSHRTSQARQMLYSSDGYFL